MTRPPYGQEGDLAGEERLFPVREQSEKGENLEPSGDTEPEVPLAGFRVQAISKLLAGTGAAAATTLFAVTGFLATRAYIGALGIPEHASISLDDYVQYGGRIFFVMIVQLVPIFAVFLLLGAIIGNKASFLERAGARWPSIPPLLVGATAFGVMLLELQTLNPEDPVFSSGRIRVLPPSAGATMLVTQILTAAVLLILGKWGIRWWKAGRPYGFHGALVAAAFLFAAVDLLLLPLCFGQSAMIPRSYESVTVVRDKDQPSISGALVFADAGEYFVFTGARKLVEVPKSQIKEIHYEGRQRLEQLAK